MFVSYRGNRSLSTVTTSLKAWQVFFKARAYLLHILSVNDIPVPNLIWQAIRLEPDAPASAVMVYRHLFVVKAVLFDVGLFGTPFWTANLF